MKNTTILFLIGFALATLHIQAQDTRERHYQYEILEPRHEQKPLVDGFATKRIVENLNRGLVATPSTNGKSVYLGWRLLNTDDNAISFNIYRSANGKTKRLNHKPV